MRMAGMHNKSRRVGVTMMPHLCSIRLPRADFMVRCKSESDLLITTEQGSGIRRLGWSVWSLQAGCLLDLQPIASLNGNILSVDIPLEKNYISRLVKAYTAWCTSHIMKYVCKTKHSSMAHHPPTARK